MLKPKVILLSFICGLLISLSYPNFFIPFSFVVGFYLLFSSLVNHNLKTVALFSFLAGFSFSVSSFYWIVYAISYYGGINILLSVLLFVLFASAYAIGVILVFSLVLKILFDRYGYNAFYLAPFIWVFLEFLREVFPFNGFPWNLAGYMLSYINPFAQLAATTSVYGLSFLVVFLSVVVFLFFKLRDRLSFGLVMLNLSILVALFLYGKLRIENYKDKGKPVRIAVIQGNIDESVKLKPSPEANRKVIDTYVSLMEEAQKENPDFMVLPESAIPIYPFIDTSLKYYFFERLEKIKTPILIGFDNVVLTPEMEIDKLYNSVFLMGDRHNYVDYYNKIKLVPFGEYTPFKIKVLEQIFTYLQGVDFNKGDAQKLLVYGEVRFTPLVCFESVFPDFVSNFTRKGGNLIVNITNDGWFGKTAGPYQHFEMARIRAIENGVYLVRAANTGISAIVNPVGEIKKHLPLMRTGYIVDDVYIGGETTFFVSHKKIIYFTFTASFLTLLGVLELKYLTRRKGEVRF